MTEKRKKIDTIEQENNQQLEVKEKSLLYCITLNNDELNLDVSNSQQVDNVDEQFHLVQVMSRKTTNVEKKDNYELEVLVCSLEAFKKFRHYLLGIPFKIVTDCQAFVKTIAERIQCR